MTEQWVAVAGRRKRKRTSGCSMAEESRREVTAERQSLREWQ